MPPTTLPASFYEALRAIRTAQELGYNPKESSKHITVDAATSLLLAEDLGLPKDFCFSLFVGVPVKRAEQISAWAGEEQGFRRIDRLCNWSEKNGRPVPPEVRVAAYRSVLRRPDGDPREVA